MKWYNTFRRGNGTYTTMEWSAQQMLDFTILKYAVIAIVSSFLSVLVSGLCLLYRLWDYDTDDKSPSFIGIVSSLYFLIDYYNGWIVSFILWIFNSESTMRNLVQLNAVCLITHVLVLIFGDTIYFNTQGEPAVKKRILLAFTAICLIVSYLITIPFVR